MILFTVDERERNKRTNRATTKSKDYEIKFVVLLGCDLTRPFIHRMNVIVLAILLIRTENKYFQIAKNAVGPVLTITIFCSFLDDVMALPLGSSA